MSKGDRECPNGICTREYFIYGRGKTVSLLLTEVLRRFEVWSKFFNSKEIRFFALIRVRRFQHKMVRGMLLLSLSKKFIRDAPDLQTLNSISPLKYYKLQISCILL